MELAISIFAGVLAALLARDLILVFARWIRAAAIWLWTEIKDEAEVRAYMKAHGRGREDNRNATP